MSCKHPIQVKIKYKDQSPTARKQRIMRDENPDFFIGFVPCGKCYACLSYRRNQWTFRLRQEAYDSADAYFITLTYAEEPLEGVSKKYLQKFFKYLRDKCGYNFTYYGIGEYGTHTQRAHYHAIIFFKEMYNVDEFVNDVTKAHSIRLKKDMNWQYDVRGFLQVASISLARLHYITHYHVRPKNQVEGKNSTFAIMSKGLGAGLFNNPKMVEMIKKSPDYNIVDLQGNKTILPAYYRKKYGIEKKDCHCSFNHPIIKDKHVFDKWLDMTLVERVRYIQMLAAADDMKLENYNKQVKLNNI